MFKKAGFLLFFLLIFSLRLLGFTFGLPYDGIHPTENVTIIGSLHYLTSGNLKPLQYQHPTLFQYLVSACGVILRLPVSAYSEYYLLARFLACCASVVSVYVLYILGRRLFDSGLFAIVCAAMLGFNVLSIKYAHYAVPDSLCVLFISLSLLFALEIIREPSFKNYLVCALWCGLSLGSKFSGFIALGTLVCAHCAVIQSGKKIRAATVLCALSTCLLVFFAVSPWHVLKFKEALADFSGYISEKGYLRASGIHSSGLFVYPILLWQGAVLGAAGSIVCIAGALGMFVRDRGRFIVICAPPILYYLVLGREKGGTLQNVLPLLPYFSTAGAYFFFLVGRNVNKRLLLPVLFLFFLFPLVLAAVFDYSLMQKDTRVLAQEWLVENVAPGTKIGFEAYTPVDLKHIRVSPAVKRFNAINFLPTLSEFPAEYFIEKGFDYIVTSGFRYDMYKSFCEKEHLCEGFENYRGFDKDLKLVAVFDAPDFRVTGICKPWGTWPHNPVIKIYRVGSAER